MHSLHEVYEIKLIILCYDMSCWLCLIVNIFNYKSTEELLSLQTLNKWFRNSFIHHRISRIATLQSESVVSSDGCRHGNRKSETSEFLTKEYFIISS